MMESLVGRSPLLESHASALALPQVWVPPVVVAVVVQLNSMPVIPMHSVLVVPMVMSVLPSAVVVEPMGKAVVVPCIQVVA